MKSLKLGAEEMWNRPMNKGRDTSWAPWAFTFNNAENTWRELIAHLTNQSSLVPLCRTSDRAPGREALRRLGDGRVKAAIVAEAVSLVNGDTGVLSPSKSEFADRPVEPTPRRFRKRCFIHKSW